LTSERGHPQLISVVMPTRNAARNVRAQLDALAEQDYTGAWELVVTDCGSTDGTREAVLDSASRFSAFRLARARTSLRNGAAEARNQGADLAAGDLLAFCDADDVVAPKWLTAIASHAPAGDLLAGALDTSTVNQCAVLEWHVAAAWQRSAVHRFLPSVSSANCAVWADSFAALGGFDESHPGAEDRDLAWRAQLAGYRVRAVPEAIVAYRYRPGLGATVRQRYRWGIADVRLYRDFGAAGMRRAPLDDVLRAWAWSISNIPALPWSRSRRGRWAVRTAQQAGHVIGSIRERVFFP
jgi:glycosyltransferase involved in cell wall biosynthesis